MKNRDKERQVFIKLVNKQLEPFGTTFNEVKDNPNWYMEYRTTPEDEQKFIKWGVDLIRKELRINKQRAVLEMNWFILQWGLTTVVSEEIEQKTTVNSDKNKV